MLVWWYHMYRILDRNCVITTSIRRWVADVSTPQIMLFIIDSSDRRLGCAHEYNMFVTKQIQIRGLRVENQLSWDICRRSVVIKSGTGKNGEHIIISTLKQVADPQNEGINRYELDVKVILHLIDTIVI
jgi:hypothetical protein